MLLALLFMRFEAIPSLRKLCRRLKKRRYAREICEFIGDRAPKHNTFSLFISRAGPDRIEDLFSEFRDQAFRMGIWTQKLLLRSLGQHFHEGVFEAWEEGRHR
jgi:Transposase domain (DUF772)